MFSLSVFTPQVFETGKTFNLDEDKVHNILHSPEVSLAEAKRSPHKRKISIQGQLTKVCFFCQHSQYIENHFEIFSDDQSDIKCTKVQPY